jgi:hypothetical protein
MRIYLTVLRNGLPTTEVVWALSDAKSLPSSFTISKLLEQVNEVIPLEAEEWGLEDYVVKIGEYECIHFQPVYTLLRENDHVV